MEWYRWIRNPSSTPCLLSVTAGLLSNLLSPQAVATRINREGLASTYAQMKTDYEQSNVLNRDALRKIAGAVGVRYVLQPRLVTFSQTTEDRWTFPPFSFRFSHTRSSVLRLTLRLWDGDTGEIVWDSAAEATMQNEALSEDPIYFEDIAQVALGSMLSDFMNRKTASRYTPVNAFLNNLVEAIEVHENSTTEPGEPKPK